MPKFSLPFCCAHWKSRLLYSCLCCSGVPKDFWVEGGVATNIYRQDTKRATDTDKRWSITDRRLSITDKRWSITDRRLSITDKRWSITDRRLSQSKCLPTSYIELPTVSLKVGGGVTPPHPPTSACSCSVVSFQMNTCISCRISVWERL